MEHPNSRIRQLFDVQILRPGPSLVLLGSLFGDVWKSAKLPAKMTTCLKSGFSSLSPSYCSSLEPARRITKPSSEPLIRIPRIINVRTRWLTERVNSQSRGAITGSLLPFHIKVIRPGPLSARRHSTLIMISCGTPIALGTNYLGSLLGPVNGLGWGVPW